MMMMMAMYFQNTPTVGDTYLCWLLNVKTGGSLRGEACPAPLKMAAFLALWPKDLKLKVGTVTGKVKEFMATFMKVAGYPSFN